jgi:adenylate cyclase
VTESDEGHAALEAIDRLILGARPQYTSDEVLSQTDVPEPVVKALWRAMGFPDSRGAAIFTDADLDALGTVASLIDQGLLDESVAVTVARALGQTTARLADWQVEALGRALVESSEFRLDDIAASGDTIDRQAWGVVLSRAQALLPSMQELLVHVWRRHVAAAMERRLAPTEESTDVTESVVFADLVGFTRLARQLEDVDLARMIDAFESVSSQVVADSHAHLIKTIGDEVLFTTADPTAATGAAFALHARAHSHPDLPELRIGIATGPVLHRMGDVFGSTVNLASRLTALARPGTTRVDAATARVLSTDAAIVIRQTAPQRLRGIGVVRSFEVDQPRR